MLRESLFEEVTFKLIHEWWEGASSVALERIADRWKPPEAPRWERPSPFAEGCPIPLVWRGSGDTQPCLLCVPRSSPRQRGACPWALIPSWRNPGGFLSRRLGDRSSQTSGAEELSPDNQQTCVNTSSNNDCWCVCSVTRLSEFCPMCPLLCILDLSCVT